jgi:hypothetical protein
MSVSVPGGAFSNGATPAALLVRMRVLAASVPHRCSTRTLRPMVQPNG